jgi:hypothetical protein
MGGLAKANGAYSTDVHRGRGNPKKIAPAEEGIHPGRRKSRFTVEQAHLGIKSTSGQEFCFMCLIL